ncbi:MAG TPA: M14 family metallocarboxypeptidase [Verrucomicrobiae bacterium]
MERLGQNIGGYRGEVIDIEWVLRQIDQAIEGKHWEREPDFPALRRDPPNARANVYMSAGIHGDEPAGPLAVLRLLTEDLWPADAAIWLCPCLNPGGFRLNRRENADGVDLNRDYRALQTAEVRAHVRWLERQPRFDVSICLHEDWEANGFYVYELNPDNGPSLAGNIIEAVSKVCPVDLSTTIETWAAEGGVIRPNVVPADRPLWPESLYLTTHKTRRSYTLEAPSDFPVPARVAALVAAARAVLDAVAAR